MTNYIFVNGKQWLDKWMVCVLRCTRKIDIIRWLFHLDLETHDMKERGPVAQDSIVPYPGILSILANSHSLLQRGHTLLVRSQRWMQSK